ncbi:MAG TPA: PIN domain-containing protein [Thermoanaerobaculia bacterium]|nr:PIN domain-containing protein [Thermoanaerobaculia bacterium]
MKVLVDTSVWVDFLNGYPSPERQALASLVPSDHEICTCGVIVAEVFQGLRREEGLARLAARFRDLTYLEPAGIDLYFRAADLYRALRQRGKTIRSTIDCLIAALADEHGCSLLARDGDMDLLLASGLLKVDRWPIPGTASS